MNRFYLAAGLTTMLTIFSGPVSPVEAQAQFPVNGTIPMEAAVTTRATGTFEVKVTPIATSDAVDTGGFGRLALDKRFAGDLTGTSRGQMLAAGTEVEGSGGYVALERVSGTLNGWKGSFILQHTGTMSHGTYDLRVTVVPDSGTDQLTGIA